MNVASLRKKVVRDVGIKSPEKKMSDFAVRMKIDGGPDLMLRPRSGNGQSLFIGTHVIHFFHVVGDEKCEGQKQRCNGVHDQESTQNLQE